MKNAEKKQAASIVWFRILADNPGARQDVL
jgi:hypothetical protein